MKGSFKAKPITYRSSGCYTRRATVAIIDASRQDIHLIPTKLKTANIGNTIMKISKHIQKVADTTSGIKSADLLQQIWNNKNTPDYFTVNVVSVARSGASRKMTIAITYLSKTYDVTKLVGEVLENSVSYGVMTVHGGGMDMIFKTLYDLYLTICSSGSETGICKLKAVNHYQNISE